MRYKLLFLSFFKISIFTNSDAKKSQKNSEIILLNEEQVNNVLEFLESKYNHHNNIKLYKDYNISLKELSIFFVFVHKIIENFLKNSSLKVHQDIYDMYVKLHVEGNELENIITIIELFKHYLFYEQYKDEATLENAYKDYIYKFFSWQVKVIKLHIPIENTEMASYLEDVKEEFEKINYSVHKIIVNIETVINWTQSKNLMETITLNADDLSLPMHVICPLVSEEYIKMKEMIQNYRYWLWGREVNIEKKMYTYYIITDVIKNTPLNKEEFIEMTSNKLLTNKIKELAKKQKCKYEDKEYLLSTYIDKILFKVFFNSRQDSL